MKSKEAYKIFIEKQWFAKKIILIDVSSDFKLRRMLTIVIDTYYEFLDRYFWRRARSRKKVK